MKYIQLITLVYLLIGTLLTFGCLGRMKSEAKLHEWVAMIGLWPAFIKTFAAFAVLNYMMSDLERLNDE